MTNTIAQPREKREQKTQGMPPYNVVLLDDDEHSFEYVIHMLGKIFGHPPEKGYGMAIEVHTSGRVVVDTTNLEKALDVEGDETTEEPAERFGTRHRSAYRLCNELRDVISVVVSQDSNVRFVKYKDGAVTYWDQA